MLAHTHESCVYNNTKDLNYNYCWEDGTRVVRVCIQLKFWLVNSIQFCNLIMELTFVSFLIHIWGVLASQLIGHSSDGTCSLHRYSDACFPKHARCLDGTAAAGSLCREETPCLCYALFSILTTQPSQFYSSNQQSLTVFGYSFTETFSIPGF